MIIRFGGAVGVGAAGEIANVTQAFQPSGRFSAANSLYAFRQVALHVADRENESVLRARACHLGAEAADAIAGTAVAAERPAVVGLFNRALRVGAAPWRP